MGNRRAVGTRSAPMPWISAVQFACDALPDILRDAAGRTSTDRGRWLDNVFVERLWRTSSTRPALGHSIWPDMGHSIGARDTSRARSREAGSCCGQIRTRTPSRIRSTSRDLALPATLAESGTWGPMERGYGVAGFLAAASRRTRTRAKQVSAVRESCLGRACQAVVRSLR